MQLFFGVLALKICIQACRTHISTENTVWSLTRWLGLGASPKQGPVTGNLFLLQHCPNGMLAPGSTRLTAYRGEHGDLHQEA